MGSCVHPYGTPCAHEHACLRCPFQQIEPTELHVGIVIVIESALSFLGVGVPPPAPSWGNMISTGQVYLATDPELVLVPSVVLFVTVVAVNVLGDALRSRWAS